MIYIVTVISECHHDIQLQLAEVEGCGVALNEVKGYQMGWQQASCPQVGNFIPLSQGLTFVKGGADMHCVNTSISDASTLRYEPRP